MRQNPFSLNHLVLGRVTAWAIFSVELVYIIVTALGFISLRSPQEPIGDPYFTMMELLTILVAALLVVNMVAIHYYASPTRRFYSLAALSFTIILACLTSSVHFVILTMRRPLAVAGFAWLPLFLSFTWPSVSYTLDILAWDVFFALSMLFAAFVFTRGPLEKAVRYLMIASGVLSLLGLIGVALGNMNVRDIGIVGYTLVAAAAFLMLALVFDRAQQSPDQI